LSIFDEVRAVTRRFERINRKIRESAKVEPRRIITEAKPAWPSVSGKTRKSLRARASLSRSTVRVTLRAGAKNRRGENYPAVAKKKSDARPYWDTLVVDPALKVWDSWAKTFEEG
jgi:hypothetical protein